MFDREHLDSHVADGWLRSQRHPDADLWIYNYTEKTQYENRWTPETLACRGLILDAAGGIVARPFPKFFNYGTPQVGELPAEPFTVTEKVDGSLGILYYLDGVPHIATRGSFMSEQAIVGTRMIREREIEQPLNATALFEIVYPENRIVVDYGGRSELVLLAAIDHSIGWDLPLPAYDGPAVERYDGLDIDTLAELAQPNREGFVVAFESGLRVKVKFAEYVRLHKIVTGINARRIWDALRNGDDLDSLLDGVPDEIYRWISATASEIEGAYADAETAALRVFYDHPSGVDRKTLAAYFIASDVNPAVLFRMLDGKPYADLIWGAIKPGPNTPADLLRGDGAAQQSTLAGADTPTSV